MVTKKKATPVQKHTNRPATKPLIAERAPRSKPRPYPCDNEKVNIIGTIALVIILITCGGVAYWLY